MVLFVPWIFFFFSPFVFSKAVAKLYVRIWLSPARRLTRVVKAMGRRLVVGRTALDTSHASLPPLNE